MDESDSTPDRVAELERLLAGVQTQIDMLMMLALADRATTTCSRV